MLRDRGRWVVVGLIVAGAAAVVAVGLHDREQARPEAVHVAVAAEAVLCAEVGPVAAEASSDGLERGPSPKIVQDPRCDELAAAPQPGELMLPHHSEAIPGSVVLTGELRFDEQQRCFYVLAGDEPIGVVWPTHFNGETDPPRITVEGQDGTVVALGDRFEVRGRYVPDVGDDCGPVEPGSSGFIASGDLVLTAGP